MSFPTPSQPSAPRRLTELADYSTRAELSAFTGLSEATLRRYAVDNRGPRITRLGGRAVRYAREDVVAWLEAQRDAVSA
jgi:predicted DNA-binding transcriptional regulator AlpA